MNKPNPNISKKFKSIARTIQQEQNAKSAKPKYQGTFPKYLKGSRNITSEPFRKSMNFTIFFLKNAYKIAFFGVGNHFYPLSRASVGIWVIEQYVSTDLRHHVSA